MEKIDIKPATKLIIRQLILNYVKENDGVLLSDIKKRFNMKKSNLTYYLNILENQGKIRRESESAKYLQPESKKTYVKRVYIVKPKNKEEIKQLKEQIQQLTMLNKQLIEEKQQLSMERIKAPNYQNTVYDKINVKKLKQELKEREIKFESNAHKSDLIKLLIDHDSKRDYLQ